MSRAEAYANRYFEGLISPGPERFRAQYAEFLREDMAVAFAIDREEREGRLQALRKAIAVRRAGPAGRRGTLRFKGAALQVKEFDCRFKAAQDPDTFRMYGLAFGSADTGPVDRQGDVILPGAVKNREAFLSEGWIAWSHRSETLPIAIPIDAEQDDYGLLVTSRWHDTEFAREVRATVRQRALAGKRVLASVGYEVLGWEPARIDGRPVRLLKAINVWECSIVCLPANPRASVLADSEKGNRSRDVIGSNVYA